MPPSTTIARNRRCGSSFFSWSKISMDYFRPLAISRSCRKLVCEHGPVTERVVEPIENPETNRASSPRREALTTTHCQSEPQPMSGASAGRSIATAASATARRRWQRRRARIAHKTVPAKSVRAGDKSAKPTTKSGRMLTPRGFAESESKHNPPTTASAAMVADWSAARHKPSAAGSKSNLRAEQWRKPSNVHST